MSKRPKLEVSISVCGQGCLDQAGAEISPEELEAIAAVFQRAATAVRNKEHGDIVCMNPDEPGDYLVNIGIDRADGPHGDGEKKPYLPVLEMIKVERRKRIKP